MGAEAAGAGHRRDTVAGLDRSDAFATASTMPANSLPGTNGGAA